MDREKQALKRLLAYVLNEFESTYVEISHDAILGGDTPLVEWNATTKRYEVCDD